MTKNTRPSKTLDNPNIRLVTILLGSFVAGLALSFPIHWLLESSLETSLINTLCTFITLLLYAAALKVWYPPKTK